MKGCVFLVFCFWALLSRATDLPPPDEVKNALKNSPLVKESLAGIDLEKTNDSRLKSGPYEYTVQMTGGKRDDKGIRESLNEWSLQVSRPIRFPGKGSIDGEIGKQGMVSAALAHGDAMHESAKSLLKLWFAWLREKAQENEWQNQARLLQEETAMVEKRVKAGDAPKLELTLARAASDQARFSELQAGMREAVAAKMLTVSFPEISLPENPVPDEPQPLEKSLDYWKDAILSQNHAVLLAKSEAKKAQLLASRSRAEETPDPTLGISYSSEYGGSQQVVMGMLSFPLPGKYRQAATQGATASAEMAGMRELDISRRAEAEVSSNYIMAKASYNGWEKSREAAKGMIKNAELVSSAYALGEASLGELLAARRLSIESILASKLARIDALETRYRLMVDAHLLWDFDEGDNTRQQ
ncbi:MAG: TolC family protein [Burkholderiales bacterium]|nr:TolC family protein [Burkholderiales bacterium]